MATSGWHGPIVEEPSLEPAWLPVDPIPQNACNRKGVAVKVASDSAPEQRGGCVLSRKAIATFS